MVKRIKQFSPPWQNLTEEQFHISSCWLLFLNVSANLLCLFCLFANFHCFIWFPEICSVFSLCLAQWENFWGTYKQKMKIHHLRHHPHIMSSCPLHKFPLKASPFTGCSSGTDIIAWFSHCVDPFSQNLWQCYRPCYLPAVTNLPCMYTKTHTRACIYPWLYTHTRYIHKYI